MTRFQFASAPRFLSVSARFSVIASILTCGGLAVPRIAAAVQPATTEAAAVMMDFDTLQKRFQSVYESLKASGGLLGQDRTAVRALGRSIEAFVAENPDHVAANAMDLQVALWLDEDADRIAAGFAKIAELRPDDAAIAIASLDHQLASGSLERSDLSAAYGALVRRFPGNLDVVRAYVPLLKDEGLPNRIIEVLRGISFDPTEDADLQVALAEASFAMQDFDAATAALDQMGTLPGRLAGQEVRASRLRAELDKIGPKWEAEKAIRAAEDAAGDLPRVAIETDRGRVVVVLYENEAPNTVANFISLAENGFYNGTSFHLREPGTRIVGGDPNTKEGAEGIAGRGNAGYTIPDEHGDAFPAGRPHLGDVIAMAGSPARDSASSQFYFALQPMSYLDGIRTVFGRVVEGLDVVRALREDDRIRSVTVLSKRDRDYVPEKIAIPDPEAPPLPPTTTPATVPSADSDTSSDGGTTDGSTGGADGG